MDGDVIIVGAGPTGLMLAVELRLAGVRPLVLERHPQIRDVPKAGGLGGQILEVLRYRGLLERFETARSAPSLANLRVVRSRSQTPPRRWTQMPILMIMDIEGATAEQYDGVDELLGGLTPENAPAGLISHAAAVTDTGFIVADVWESAEDLQRFFDEKLGAAIAEAGLPRAEPRVVPVHNHIEGSGEEGAVLVLVELDGMTTDDYDALTSDMEAHAGDGSAHPSVAHVIGITDNGLVAVDIWESGQAFAEFGETELAPRMGPDQMARMQPRVSELHNHVRVKAPTTAG